MRSSCAKVILSTIGLTLAAGLASPAIASEPRARLVACDVGSCLLLSGRRDEVASVVRVNGHAVPVEGRRRWRARLPVDTVRRWSAPHARSITLTTADPTGGERVEQVDLPIGLLGSTTQLASLVIRVR